MPEALKDVYGVTMWLATAGYLVFMHYVFFRVETVEARVGKRSGFGVVNSCCAAVVVASALQTAFLDPFVWPLFFRAI